MKSAFAALRTQKFSKIRQTFQHVCSFVFKFSLIFCNCPKFTNFDEFVPEFQQPFPKRIKNRLRTALLILPLFPLLFHRERVRVSAVVLIKRKDSLCRKGDYQVNHNS